MQGTPGARQAGRPPPPLPGSARLGRGPRCWGGQLSAPQGACPWSLVRSENKSDGAQKDSVRAARGPSLCCSPGARCWTGQRDVSSSNPQAVRLSHSGPQTGTSLSRPWSTWDRSGPPTWKQVLPTFGRQPCPSSHPVGGRCPCELPGISKDNRARASELAAARPQE